MLVQWRRPEGSTQRSHTAKTYMRNGPMTKLGTLMPTSATTESTLSVSVPRRIPATTPSGMAIETATMSAASAS